MVDDIHINSKLTEGEDVADLGGTILAYIAWKNADKSQKLTDRDGLTPDQRFFVGFAQWACANERPGRPAGTRHHRSALAAEVPRQRRGGEHAGVRHGVLLQARLAHGEAGRQGVQGVVSFVRRLRTSWNCRKQPCGDTVQ